MPATTPIVQAAALTKSFGRRVAVRGVDLELASGDCLALFGPNGAGKTTLLRLIAGLLKPTTGQARVQGVDVRRDTRARARVALATHAAIMTDGRFARFEQRGPSHDFDAQRYATEYRDLVGAGRAL